jgi:C1A family cysteine protease
VRIVPSRLGRRYGYSRKRLINPFAVRYTPRFGVVELPHEFDLTPLAPPVVNQEDTSSCTANAIAGAYQFERLQAGLPPLTPSRLFIYWNERAMEGDTGSDAGAFGGDGLSSLETLGVCDESLWPFDPNPGALLLQKPSPAAFAAATANKITNKAVVFNINEIKSAIADKHFVPFGITLYESFESDEVAETGIVPIPLPTEGVLGGHEMNFVGWNDKTQRLKARNSWAASWGIGGYCWIPYSYVMSAGSDFEVITGI